MPFPKVPGDLTVLPFIQYRGISTVVADRGLLHKDLKNTCLFLPPVSLINESWSIMEYGCIYRCIYGCIDTSIYISQALSFHVSVCSLFLYICLSICLSACLSVWLAACLAVWLSVCLSVRPSVRLSVCLSVCLSACLSVCLSIYLSVCLSVCLSICLCAYWSYCRRAYEWVFEVHQSTIHVDESCHICECAMSHVWIHRTTHMTESYHTCEGDISHLWPCLVTHVTELCNTCEWDMSRMRKSQVTRAHASSHTWMSHVAHEWVTSHIWTRNMHESSEVHVSSRETHARNESLTSVTCLIHQCGMPGLICKCDIYHLQLWRGMSTHRWKRSQTK